MTSPGGDCGRTLRVLYLEDDPRDAELTRNVLEEGGFVCEEDRVDTQEAFVLALERGRPLDLILADYMVPGFDVQEALAIARRLRPEVPFILVSGKVGEETAIDMLHAGATDYVLKQRLARLLPAVERALREKESESRYRSLFEHMSEGLAYCRMLYDGDRPIDFVYLDVNPAFEMLTGLKGVVGKRVSEVIPGILESDPGLIERYARVARGSPERFQTYVESLRNWFGVSVYSPARGDFVAAFDVITDRKRAEEELRKSEQRLRLAQEAARIGAFEWDIQADVNTWTPELEAMYGLPRGGFAGTEAAWESLVHPDDRANVVRRVEEAMQTGAPIEVEWRVVWPDGSVHWLAGRAQVFKDGSGKPLRLTGINIDITDRKCAEEALRASEERLRLAQAVARVGTFDWDIQTGVNIWTPELEALYGLPRGGFAKTEAAWENLVHPDDRAGAIRRVEHALETGGTTEAEWRVVWPDGSVHWLAGRWQVFKDPTGKPLRMTGINMDITERKRAEELHASEAALREVRERELAAERAVREASQLWAGQLEQVNEQLKVSAVEAQAASEREAIARGAAERREQELETLFGSMRDGVIVYEENGRILKTNKAVTLFFGTDVLGLTMAELIQRFDIRYSDEIARAGSPVAEDRLPGKRALLGEVVEGARMRARSPAGLRDVLVSASPLYRDAAAWGALTVFRDVTDYERAVEVARRAEEQLRLSHDAIFVWHLQHGIESWNRGAEDLYGFASSTALRRNPQELLRTRFPRPREEIERELIRRRRWEGELVQTTEDGRTVVVSGKLQLIRYDGDDHVLEVNRDITDAKRAEDALRESERQLREADRRKDEFLATLSHELRNPLAPIRNSLYVLDHAAPGGDQARHAKEVIERQVNQLTRLVADLLDVSRITRGKVQLQRERLDLRDVVHRTLEDHRSMYGARGLELREEQPGRPVWVDADPTRMAQALTNLLNNAAKFTKEGGSVSVALRQEGKTAVLQVRDDGAGIAPDLLAKIFEPFTQGEQPLARSTGGLGLGLALVKGLVELHGGTAIAHSDGIGKGALITLRLPAEETPATVARPELKLVQPVARRVLVIEDNVDAAESLKEALELQEHEVALAFSGPEGLEKARAFMPDLVLCDIGLPGMDGYEVARAFRSDERLHEIPLVAMTGYALSEDQKKAEEAGFDRHLAKPAGLDTLERMLAELPRRRAG
jgi:PAS domain S-box-containing protein